jgi:hypothetical protein
MRIVHKHSSCAYLFGQDDHESCINVGQPFKLQLRKCCFAMHHLLFLLPLTVLVPFELLNERDIFWSENNDFVFLRLIL